MISSSFVGISQNTPLRSISYSFFVLFHPSALLTAILYRGEPPYYYTLRGCGWTPRDHQGNKPRIYRSYRAKVVIPSTIRCISETKVLNWKLITTQWRTNLANVRCISDTKVLDWKLITTVRPSERPLYRRVSYTKVLTLNANYRQKLSLSWCLVMTITPRGRVLSSVLPSLITLCDGIE